MHFHAVYCFLKECVPTRPKWKLSTQKVPQHRDCVKLRIRPRTFAVSTSVDAPAPLHHESVFEYLLCNVSRVLKISRFLLQKSMNSLLKIDKYEFVTENRQHASGARHFTFRCKGHLKQPRKVEKGRTRWQGWEERSWAGEPIISVRLSFRLPSFCSVQTM